jgi:hypothetical protein
MVNQLVKIINLTPHQVDVLDINGNIITYPIDSKGRVARGELNTEKCGLITNKYIELSPTHNILKNACGKITITDSEGNVTNFPKPKHGILYIVSAIVANALKRPDCIIVANRLRNPDGTLGAASGFSFVN